MNNILCHLRAKQEIMLITLAALLFFGFSTAHAAATFVTDLGDWEAMVSDIEVFETTAENVFLADEVVSFPGPNSKLGPILTFQSVNTGLSRGFTVESLQAQGASDPSDPLFVGGFTFDDHDGGNPVADSANALSVGDTDDFEDDDWQLNLLDGATITAFGVEIRHSRFASGETITLYLLSRNQKVAALDLSSLPSTGNDRYFIGIVSDVPFDSIKFDEDPDSDDIAIADFRFATAMSDPEIEARVDLKPERINLKSRGRYVTTFIELPDGYAVRDISLRSVVISGINGDVIDPPLYRVGPSNVGDYDRDRNPDLMVKFSRQKLIRLLKVDDETITISGELRDGTKFSGTDRIRVKCFKCSKKKYKKIMKKFRNDRAKHRH